MRKLKVSEIKTVREQLLKKNNFKCGLCGLPISEDDAVHLDHEHKNGHIRDAIHARCNTTLGKIENHLVRAGFKTDEEKSSFLMNVWRYIKLHETDQSGLRHPSHRTPEEKRELAKKRRKDKRTRNLK